MKDLRSFHQILFFLLLFTFYNSNAQGLLRLTRSEIIKHYSNIPGDAGVFELSYNETDRILTVYEKTLNYWLFYGFDVQNLCRMSVTQYSSQKSAQDHIEWLNKEAVIISEVEWRYYLPNNLIISVNLSVKDGLFNFIYTYKVM